MTKVPSPEAFYRWASAVRTIGRVISRTTTSPDQLPDTHGRPVVMVANHRSLADVFLAVDALGRYRMPARCLVHHRYFSTPGLGWWLGAIGCIPAGGGDRSSVDVALATLKGGRPVAVMAEGRITPPDQRDADGLGEFRTGFIDIARASGGVILPIGITGADELWRSTAKAPRLQFRRPPVHIGVGESIIIDDLDDAAALAATRTSIRDLLRD